MFDYKGFEKYLFEEELSSNTIENYMYGLKKYAEMFDEINKPNLIAFKKSLCEKYKPKSVNNRITGMMRYCQYKGIDIKLKHIKEEKQTHIDNIISAEEYQRLIDNLTADGQERWRANVMLLAKTGMRISEALRITKKNLIDGKVELFSKGHMRTIYFPKSLVQELSEYLKPMSDDEKVMKNKYGKPLTSRGVSEALKRFAQKYDIPKEVMHPHAFRHFFAIEFLKRNNNIALLADLLGHSGVNITQIYLRQSQEQQKNAIDAAVNW